VHVQAGELMCTCMCMAMGTLYDNTTIQMCFLPLP